MSNIGIESEHQAVPFATFFYENIDIELFISPNKFIIAFARG